MQGSIQDLTPPLLDLSDHITIMLRPAYTTRVRAISPTKKKVRVWPKGASSALEDCFNTTDWDIFKQAATHNDHIGIEEYTETVTAYITKCMDDVTHSKTITVRANQKPWLTGWLYRHMALQPPEGLGHST